MSRKRLLIYALILSLLMPGLSGCLRTGAEVIVVQHAEPVMLLEDVEQVKVKARDGTVGYATLRAGWYAGPWPGAE